MTRFFGTTFEYHNFVTSAVYRVSVATSALSASRLIESLFMCFHQFRLEDVVEEINEAHVSAWATMIQTSDPPIPNTSLSAYMNPFALSKHSMAFSNAKAKKVLGYELKRPNLTVDVLQEIVDKWKDEGSWPKLKG